MSANAGRAVASRRRARSVRSIPALDFAITLAVTLSGPMMVNNKNGPNGLHYIDGLREAALEARCIATSPADWHLAR